MRDETNKRGVELYETPSGKKLPGLSTIKFPSGVVATDLVFGSGATAMPNSVIKVHYHGTLPDGKVFDSTRGSDPITFPLNQLIPGWREGIPGMMVGGVRRLVVPAKEAYGDEGAPPDIPPKTDLVFTIELVDVVEKK
ncbi:MAG: FKBP-type peptidyl-prolyl cis-trans isomerase [Phycisphaerales bacterium]|nr:FKBP-type peptidyl-prolyl cis-trans isomerase [Phycisphaerales bacterium]